MKEERFDEVVKGLEELVEWRKGSAKVKTSLGVKTEQEVKQAKQEGK